VGAPVAETAQRMATAAVVKWNIVMGICADGLDSRV
jgi:hypothetical protein